MSVEYDIDDLTGLPCVPYIYNQVYMNAFADMLIESATWDGDSLKVVWGRALTSGEQAVLREYAVSSVGKRRIIVEATDIVDQIFWVAMATGGMALVLKLCDAFDAIPSSRMALDNYNYPLARARVQKMYADGLVTLDEMNLMLSKIPEHEYV